MQAQCPTHRDGRPSDRLRTQRAVPLLHPRGRIRVAEGTRRVSASAGPRQRLVQFVLSLEGHRRVYQHIFLVSDVCHAARRPSAEVLQGRERVVARGRRVHDQFMAGTRPRTFTEHLRRRNRPENMFKGLFRRPRRVPRVRACVRPRCSISTNNFDSSKTEHCLSLTKTRPETSENVYCALASKWVRGGLRPLEDAGPIAKF